MLNWFFEIFAPSTFTKGIYKYNRGEYHTAERLLRKAAKWMPELKNDSLYEAYSFLTFSKLGKPINSIEIKKLLDKMAKNKLKMHKSFIKAEAELNALLKEAEGNVLS